MCLWECRRRLRRVFPFGANHVAVQNVLRLSFDGRIFSNRASLPSYFDSNQGMKGAITVN